ncbi:MAG: nucleotidyl transferase AbiEii/AbiGii toxin family protein [Anaerolineales bacterium]|nr:nucleotidyl transferase AbiEii/AbiGii toxin family protein [Anaerolineales bacterium]
MPDRLRGFGILTPIQKAFLSVFASLPDQSQFFLAGGTALAEYYFGHRLSFDLDIFTGVDGLVLPTSYQIEKVFAEHGLQIQVTRRFSSFAQFLFTQGQDSLKIDLAFDSPYRFEPPVLTETGVYVNDYADLRVDKLLAYFGRAEPRDAVDLYFIMQREPLETLLAQAADKDPGFDLYWFASALHRAESFPDEAERWPVKMIKPFEPVKLKKQFRELAIELMKKVGGTGKSSTP